MSNQEQSNDLWPLPKFYFRVSFGPGAQAVSFQEISGLDVDVQAIEYRHGDNPQFSTIKMPGIAKTGSVTMKKGIFASDNKFWDWYNAIKMNTIDRKTVTIELLDETGSPTMTWTLSNAWPTKITGTDLKSDGNEVAVEMLELSHEGLTIANG
jgi:phage tail-like protein